MKLAKAECVLVLSITRLDILFSASLPRFLLVSTPN